MKRVLSVMLTMLFLLSNVLVFNVSAAPDIPTAEDMDGYENLCLTYTFRRTGSGYSQHYEEDLLPYTAYLDEQGNIQDFFFDSYLFLPCVDYGPSGARLHVDVNNPTKAIDWTTYVEDTFYDGANVDALDAAYGQTKAALNDTESKAGVFFTILYPCRNARNFGELGGRNLDFYKTEDRKYAIKWIIDEQIRLYEEAGYENLELVGFYWLEEFMVESADKELFQYASEYLHSKGLKFIWIPWYRSEGHQRWEELGFDVVCMQPNLYWMSYADPYRIQQSISISESLGMGMEMEVDSNVVKDEYFNRYLNYLQSGLVSGMMNGVKMYYQDGKPAVYYQACYSKNQRYRTVYDLTYKYAKGTLTQSDIDAVRPEGLSSGFVDDVGFSDIMSRDVDWVSIGKSYTGCRSYVDGNGMAYQDVDGKELTDGIIADEAVSTDWHAFHLSIRDSEGRMSITVDLGEVRDDLTDFAAHFDNRHEFGIGSPTQIKISVSNDGTNFRHLASPELTLDSVNSCISYQCEPVSARYVKLSLVPGDGNFVFCSEFLVGAARDTEDVQSEVDDSSSEDSVSVETSENTAEPDGSSDGNFPMIVIVLAVMLVIVILTVIRKRK